MKLDPRKVQKNVIALLIRAVIYSAILLAITNGHPHKWALALQLPLIGWAALNMKWTDGEPKVQCLKCGKEFEPNPDSMQPLEAGVQPIEAQTSPSLYAEIDPQELAKADPEELDADGITKEQRERILG
jgi:hypothetical protein